MKTKLRALRVNRELTLAQVQAATGIDVGNLSRIERGAQEPKASQALLLIDFFAPDLALGDLTRKGDTPAQPTTPEARAA